MTDEEKKEELEAILDSGVAQITIDNKSETYRSQADLERILHRLEVKTGARKGSIGYNPYFSKGL